MRHLLIIPAFCVLITNGCSTPPQADPKYTHAAHHIHLASSSRELDRPATLPKEEHLEGAHPVDFYVRIALERNPEILAAQRGVAATAEIIPQVAALDDPMLIETFQPIASHSVQTRAGRGVNMLTLSQKFPWFSKLRVRGEVAEQETKMALARLAQSQLRVIESVKLSYFELYFHQRAIEITEGNTELLRRLIKSADARYTARKASYQDVLRGQIELEKLRNRLILLRRSLRQAQADLAKELHTSPESDLKAQLVTLEPAPKQIEQLYSAAVRCRPELQERLHAIVRDQRSRELARLNYYPDMTVGIGWQAVSSSSAISPVANGNDNVAFTVGVNIPLWRDKLRAGVSAAEHRMVQSARQYDAERDDTFRRIKRLVVQAETIEQQLELFRESIIPKSIRTLRISVTDYTVGKVDFQQIVDNWGELLKFQILVIRLESGLGRTLAALERVIGCQLVAVEGNSATPGRVVPPAPGETGPPKERKKKLKPGEESQEKRSSPSEVPAVP